MRRVLALLASLLLASAAEPPTKRAFLMLGGATQILDADGKVTWKYPAETRDGWVLPNGHVLLTLAKSKTYPGGAVIEVTRDLKVVFEYKGTQAEVNTAQRLPDGRTMLTEAGANPRILEVDATGHIQVEIPLRCSAKDPHFQSRMTRKQPNGHVHAHGQQVTREVTRNRRGELHGGKSLLARREPEHAEVGKEEGRSRTEYHRGDLLRQTLAGQTTGHPQAAIGRDQEQVSDRIAVGRRAEREGDHVRHPAERKETGEQPRITQPQPTEEKHGP